MKSIMAKEDKRMMLAATLGPYLSVYKVRWGSGNHMINFLRVNDDDDNGGGGDSDSECLLCVYQVSGIVLSIILILIHLILKEL